jgi:hypothetical protein
MKIISDESIEYSDDDVARVERLLNAAFNMIADKALDWPITHALVIYAQDAAHVYCVMVARDHLATESFFRDDERDMFSMELSSFERQWAVVDSRNVDKQLRVVGRKTMMSPGGDA